MENDLKTDVELLKRDVSAINNLLSRLDTAIDKIADASNGISKILAVHDQSIDALRTAVEERKRIAEKEIELIHSRISDMKDENHRERKTNHEELLRAIKEMDEKNSREVKLISERLDILERWKWWIMGAAAVLGFFISQMANISSIIP